MGRARNRLRGLLAGCYHPAPSPRFSEGSRAGAFSLPSFTPWSRFSGGKGYYHSQPPKHGWLRPPQGQNLENVGHRSTPAGEANDPGGNPWAWVTTANAVARLSKHS